jgi:hypothetical protein
MVLEFKNGVEDRPLLRNAQSEEFIKNGGTKIKVWLPDKEIISRLLESENARNKNLTFEELLEYKFPSLNVDLYFEDEVEKTKTKVVSSNDWISIDPLELIKRTIRRPIFEKLSEDLKTSIEKFSENMRLIKNSDGEIVARALVFPIELSRQTNFNLCGCVTIGGSRTNDLTSLLGIFKGESERASRDIAMPYVEKDILIEWSSEQSNLIAELDYGYEIEVACASVIRAFGGECSTLKITKNKMGYLNYPELISVIKSSSFDEIFFVSEASVFYYEKENNCHINLLENVFTVDESMPGIFQTGRERIGSFKYWPHYYENNSRTLAKYIERAISEAYDVDLKTLYANSFLTEDDRLISAKIGTVENNDVVLKNIKKFVISIKLE